MMSGTIRESLSCRGFLNISSCPGQATERDKKIAGLIYAYKQAFKAAKGRNQNDVSHNTGDYRGQNH